MYTEITDLIIIFILLLCYNKKSIERKTHNFLGNSAMIPETELWLILSEDCSLGVPILVQ